MSCPHLVELESCFLSPSLFPFRANKSTDALQRCANWISFLHGTRHIRFSMKLSQEVKLCCAFFGWSLTHGVRACFGNEYSRDHDCIEGSKAAGTEIKCLASKECSALRAASAPPPQQDGWMRIAKRGNTVIACCSVAVRTLSTFGRSAKAVRHVRVEGPVELELGGTLQGGVDIAYEEWGPRHSDKVARKRDNNDTRTYGHVFRLCCCFPASACHRTHARPLRTLNMAGTRASWVHHVPSTRTCIASSALPIWEHHLEPLPPFRSTQPLGNCMELHSRKSHRLTLRAWRACS
jgi:hypothetical protein